MYQLSVKMALFWVVAGCCSKFIDISEVLAVSIIGAANHSASETVRGSKWACVAASTVAADRIGCL
jgi:hypothetical protein